MKDVYEFAWWKAGEVAAFLSRKQETASTSVCLAQGLFLGRGLPGCPALYQALLGYLGSGAHRTARAHPYTCSEAGRHTVQRGFQDGSIQREFQVGSLIGLLVIWEGCLEVVRLQKWTAHRKQVTFQGTAVAMGRGEQEVCIFDDPAPDMVWGVGGAGRPL